AGTIESNENISKAYLIDQFINDTLAEIDIKDNKFHTVIKNEVPLENYYLIFKASNQFGTNTLCMSTNDSIYMDIQYLNNDANFKTTTGTRLAENQYHSKDEFGWSRANYMTLENSYLDRPERVVNEIYREWKEKFNESDKFRTPDNYAPQPDFTE